MSVRGDVAIFDRAVKASARFVYDHILRIVLISLLWLVASLPIVTFGVATVGAYAAVTSIREQGRIDRDLVRSRVREQAADATLLVPAPFVFLAIAGLYSSQSAPTESTTALVVALVAFYCGLYGALLLIPTLVGLARGDPVGSAVPDGQSWITDHPALALSTGFLTLLVLVATLALTVTFPMLFAGVVATLHVTIVEAAEAADSDEDPDPAPETTEEYRGLSDR